MRSNIISHNLAPLLALACAVSITACGGGGGGGDSGGNSGNGGGTQTNAVPTISGAPPNSINATSEFSFTPTASDADGDKLTFSITNSPLWAVFDTATGALSGIPYATDIGEHLDVSISVSDGKDTAALTPFNITVAPQKLGQNNFSTEGDVFATATGYQSVGTLVMDTGERVQEFRNSDLVLEFDEEGNLTSISGDTDLPVNLSDNVTVAPGIRAIVGTMSGAEINMDPSLGILLLDETKYFVFFIEVSISITVSNPFDPSDVIVEELDVPVGGHIVLISDMTDPFLYRYAWHPTKGAIGKGQSFNGLIPFEPYLDYPGLDSFNGHVLEKGTMKLKLSKLTFGNVDAMRVTRNASFFDIDWDAPLESPIEYRAGINGTADIFLNIPIVGDFSFAQAELGATIDVGLDRQQAAFALHLDAAVTTTSPFVPAWFHMFPSGSFDGEGTVAGTGEIELNLFGSFQSTVPPANVSGTMRLSNDGVTLAATTVENGDNLEVSLEFMNEQTVGRIKFPQSFAISIADDVSAALDRETDNVRQKLQELQDATADYEFEASLRGLRAALPPMMDAAISTMNGIPGTVYTRAYNKAISVMETTCKSITAFGVTTKTCLDDIVDEVSIATDIAKKARAESVTGIKSGVDAMKTLKTRALEADDETLREALRLALDGVYNKRTYSRKVTITKTFSVFPFEDKTYTLYNETYTRKVLSDIDAQNIATARNNVWRIQSTSDIMIQAQQIYDQLPTEEIIAQIKQGVEDGTQQLPIPEGLGYRAIGDSYDAFITVDGVDHITDINVLSPSDVRTGVSDFLADLLLAPLQ